MPFITVTRCKKYADVHWDYITYPTKLDALLHRLDGELRDKAKEIYLTCSNARSRFVGSDQLIWFRDIEVSHADAAANEPYDLINGIVRDVVKNLELGS
ncbi:hypothetical protein [Halopseudomonas pelagia]|uniref:hypothetical protein n=1 Tax=Halopseudomonas pelagia TaxID=553151 RepID=UPI0030D899FD